MTSKKKVITKTLIALVIIACIGLLFYFGGQRNDENGQAIKEKAYVAIEGDWNVGVIDMDNKKFFKKIDLSEKRDGVRVFYMPHNVQVAPDNKTVWVTGNAMGGIKMGTTFDNYDQVIIIDPALDVVEKN